MALLPAFVIALVAVASTFFFSTSAEDACQAFDLPNPIAQSYPADVTGVLNGTTLIVPISLELARQVIPFEYGILERAYRSLLPAIPPGMYPMMASIYHDHDIQVAEYNATLPDFSVSRRNLSRLASYSIRAC